VYKAAIYADENRVLGVRLLSVVGPTDIGSLRGTPVLYEFGPKTQPIGFYGTYTNAGITSLGFLTHDPDCIRFVPPVPEPEPEPVIWVPVIPKVVIVEEEEEGSSGAIIAGILVPLLLIGAGVGGFFLWKKYKRGKQNGSSSTSNVAPTAPADTPENFQEMAEMQKGITVIEQEGVAKEKAPTSMGMHDADTDGNEPVDFQIEKNESQRELIHNSAGGGSS